MMRVIVILCFLWGGLLHGQQPYSAWHPLSDVYDALSLKMDSMEQRFLVGIKGSSEDERWLLNIAKACPLSMPTITYRARDLYRWSQYRWQPVVPSLVLDSLDQLQDTIKALQDSILYCDSLYQLQGQDSILLQRRQLAKQLALKLDQAINFCQQSQLNCQNNLNSLCQINSGIQPTAMAEWNEQQFKDIYLNTVAKGIFELNPQQQTQLYQIAQQCPKNGGAVVFRARSFYELVERRWWPLNCQNSTQARLVEASADSSCANSTDSLVILNPSLEADSARTFFAPNHWQICEGSPDVQPTLSFITAPFKDTLYLALSTLGGGYESVGQELEDSLRANQEYCISLRTTSISLDSVTYMPAGRLKIWLGNSICDEGELIYTSPLSDTIWRKHKICFTPSQDYSHIILSSDASLTAGSYIGVDDIRSCAPTTSVAIISDKPVTSTLKVFPNPNSGQFQLSWDLAELSSAGHLYIYDLWGRLVYQEELELSNQQLSVDFREVAPAIYRVVLETEKRRLYGNLIIGK